MNQRRLHWNGIPLWIHEPDEAARATVLVYHGLSASKDIQGKELSSMARRGLRAVGIDAVGHGERAFDDLPARLADDGPRALLEIVTATAAEVPHLLDALAGGEPFGITGISMGGYIAFAAVIADERLRRAVPILANPDWSRLRGVPEAHLEPWVRMSPARRPEAFENKWVLAMNAARDVHVPPAPAREFMARLRERWPHQAERYVYREYPESEHMMRPDDWEDLWRRAEDWFLTDDG